MAAQMYYKIQNTYALLGNEQYDFVTHTCLEKTYFISIFRIDCTKMLINFIILYHQILCITKQETQSETGCGREKSRPQGI